jgi:16S rRNA (guanine527-N7)-methyltransferase
MTYLRELLAWNKITNLTSITDEEEVIVKHFIDSLAALACEPFGSEACVLDVGAGAGFPGIPLKIASPGCILTLLEPSHKKSSFLHFMTGALKLSQTRVLTATLEELESDQKFSHYFKYIVTRALRYDSVLKHSRSLLAREGKAILYLSHPIASTDLPHAWALDREYAFKLPLEGGNRVVSVLQPQA